MNKKRIKFKMQQSRWCRKWQPTRTTGKCTASSARATNFSSVTLHLLHQPRKNKTKILKYSLKISLLFEKQHLEWNGSRHAPFRRGCKNMPTPLSSSTKSI